MEKMLELAYKEGIDVEEFDFPPPLRGIYICQLDANAMAIGLDKNLDTIAEKRSIMAEELGHHFTTVGQCISREFYNYSNRLQIDKAEYVALRWAANYLISDDDLLDALQEGLDDISSLAERFTVTPDIIKLRLKLFGKPVY
jgi:Domain of unknown function (DUF955).